jgi:hypothetical protein
MGQAKKAVALSQKVSLLKDQVSALLVEIVHLEECDLYMIEVIEAASGQLLVSCLELPSFCVVIPLCCSHHFLLRHLFGPCC